MGLWNLCINVKQVLVNHANTFCLLQFSIPESNQFLLNASSIGILFGSRCKSREITWNVLKVRLYFCCESAFWGWRRWGLVMSIKRPVSLFAIQILTRSYRHVDYIWLSPKASSFAIQWGCKSTVSVSSIFIIYIWKWAGPWVTQPSFRMCPLVLSVVGLKLLLLVQSFLIHDT